MTKTNNRHFYILGLTGLSNSFHDNSVALLKNGNIAFAASEERYSRVKHDRRFPVKAISKALSFAKISKSDIQFVAVGYPKRSFLSPFYRDPVALFSVLFKWLRGRGVGFFTEVYNIFKGEIFQNSGMGLKKFRFAAQRIIYVDHHLAHAASSYFTSGFDKCLSVSMDAFGPKTNGDILSGSVFKCTKGRIETLEEIEVQDSMGLFYTSVTLALGFTPGDGEGKTMGLAAYGNFLKAYKLLKKISPQFNNGKWRATPFWTQMFFANRKEFLPIFNSLPLGKLLISWINKYGKQDVAASAQKVLEEECLNYFRYLVKKYGANKFTLSGGLFLNVKLNKRILEIPGVVDIFIHPNSGDGGTALGAAMLVNNLKSQKKVKINNISGVNWGSEYTHREIKKTLLKYKSKVSFKVETNISGYVAKSLVKGKVIGWFQGRFEWGPRALGYRSVIIDPRRMDIKEKLNNTLKNREWFMPFAPSLMEEYGEKYFVNYRKSPFMTLAFDVKRNVLKDIKAAIHVDKTARPNTVSKQGNPKYYELINHFYKLTGIPVVLNTSFNKHGLPIVDSPKDAVEHLLWNCIDELAIGDFIVTRKNAK